MGRQLNDELDNISKRMNRIYNDLNSILVMVDDLKRDFDLTEPSRRSPISGVLAQLFAFQATSITYLFDVAFEIMNEIYQIYSDSDGDSIREVEEEND